MKVIFIFLTLIFVLKYYSIQSNQHGNNKYSDLKFNQKIGYHKSNIEEKTFYLYSLIQYEIEIKQNFYFMNSINIPSDFIENFTKDSKEKSFELLINQGRLPDEFKNNHFNKKRKNEENYFFEDDILVDYPSGYLYHSINFTPDKFSNFKNFFDLFSMVFKVTLNPLLDRSSYIKDKKSGNKFDIYFFDNNERACTEHLDAIKETLPIGIWNIYMKKINYQKFSQSDYKVIKYFVKYSPDENKIIFSYKIIYRINKNDMKDHKNLISFDMNTKNIENSLNDDKKDNNNNNSNILFNSSRYFQGQLNNFENFLYTNEFSFKSENNQFNSDFKIIDIIPDQINILLSTIKINLEANGVKFYFDYNNLDHIFDMNIVESVENQNPKVPFTYESKKTTKLSFLFKENFVKSYLSHFQKFTFNFKISYELRKKLLNFESFDNNIEFGFKFPSGLIIYDNMPYVTNHIYFNMPSVDETMPFNVIAFSWVIYGFILIQTLNLFITGIKTQKTLWQSIKDRFMAKWGFLFGR